MVTEPVMMSTGDATNLSDPQSDFGFLQRPVGRYRRGASFFLLDTLPALGDGTLRGLDASGLLRSLNLGTDELLHFLALALGTPDASFGLLFIF